MIFHDLLRAGFIYDAESGQCSGGITSAATEYKAPAEMLTDNGRQYTSWRGKVQFEKEMVRMQIRHIRSQPHHPQTQGKIERFWKTIKEEFFSRTLFDGFEDMQNRTKLWIQYYNFKRPHQALADCAGRSFLRGVARCAPGGGERDRGQCASDGAYGCSPQAVLSCGADG